MNFKQRQAARESVANEDTNAGLSNITSGEDNLDVQLADVSPLDTELDQLAGDAEVLSDDTTRIERAIDSAQVAIDSGEEVPESELTPDIVAGESIRRRWKLESRKVARESYRRGRGLTKAAQEGWKETLKGLWESLVDLIKAAIKKIKELKLKYFNVGKSAVKRAKSYEERLKKLGTKKNKDEISGSFVNKLSVNGAFDLNGSIATAKAAFSGKIKAAISTLESSAAAATAYTVAAADGNATFTGPEKVELFGSAGSKLKSLPAFEDDATSAQNVLSLPGNAYIQSGTKKLGDADYVAIAFTTTGDANDEKKIPTPGSNDLRSACGALKVTGEGFEKVLKDFDSFDTQMGKLEKAAEDVAKKFDKATEEADREALNNARRIADQNVRNYQTLNRAVHYLGRTVIAGLSGYIGAGIAAYGKADK